MLIFFFNPSSIHMVSKNFSLVLPFSSSIILLYNIINKCYVFLPGCIKRKRSKRKVERSLQIRSIKEVWRVYITVFFS
jgi:hypothetical protein